MGGARPYKNFEDLCGKTHPPPTFLKSTPRGHGWEPMPKFLMGRGLSRGGVHVTPRRRGHPWMEPEKPNLR